MIRERRSGRLQDLADILNFLARFDFEFEAFAIALLGSVVHE